MELNIAFDPTDREQTERANEILDAISDALDDSDGRTTVSDWADVYDEVSTDDPSDAADDDATDDAETDGADDPSDAADELDATLRPGTWKFKMASTLYHTADDRLSARDVEDALNGTEWKHQNPQNISRDLKYLVDDGFATRSKVEVDRGHDHFVFWLTDKGRNALEQTEADDDVTTYVDVADRGLGALFNGTETDPDGGEV